MFQLKLFDRNGKELKQGDIVKISDGKRFTFFCEVKYLEKEKVIAPFHTFSFHSFEKINKVPDNAKESIEERYKIWYVYFDEADPDNKADDFSKYLIEWRQCESLIDKRCYQIVPLENKKKIKALS